MKFTKSTLLALCSAGVLASTMAVAATPDPATFQAEKDFRLSTIQERVQIMQTHLSCVQASQDHAAMKACHDSTKQAQDALEAKVKAHHVEKKSQRQANKHNATAPASPTTTP